MASEPPQLSRLPRPPSQIGSFSPFQMVYLVCAILYVYPLWIGSFLPITDFAQHAAQVAMWLRWDDPAYGYSQYLELNYLSPHAAGYLPWLTLAHFMPVEIAGRLLLSLYVIAMPLTFLYWIRSTGTHDPWWALLGFPFAYGYSMYYGFFNFLLSIPVGLVFVGFSRRYALEPSMGRAAWLALLGTLLFLAHALTCLVLLPAGAGMVLLRRWRNIRAWCRLWPFAVIGLIYGSWSVFTASRASASWARTETTWDWEWTAVYRWFITTIGIDLREQFPEWTALAWLVSVIVLAASALRWKKRKSHWLPAGWAFALSTLSPKALMGASLIAHRISILLPPFLLSALRPRVKGANLQRTHQLLTALVVIWGLVLLGRFQGFSEEVAGLDEVIEYLPPHQRLLPLYEDRDSKSVPGFPFMHLLTMYEVAKGGHSGLSFTQFGHLPIREKHVDSERTNELERLYWCEVRFDWRKHARDYDYIVVRSSTDASALLFGEVQPPFRLAFQINDWWVYARKLPVHRNR